LCSCIFAFCFFDWCTSEQETSSRAGRQITSVVFLSARSEVWAGEGLERAHAEAKSTQMAPDMKREPIIDPVIEGPLLSLHRATNVDSFWKAARRLLSATIPNHLIRVTFQHNPVLPMIARKTRPFPNGFFAAEPLRSHIASRPRKRFVRIADLFSNRNSLTKSAFYRRYLAPHNCRHCVVFFFWKEQRLICAITIMRTAAQGDLTRAELKLLRQLYRQFLTALDRLEWREREHSARTAFEELVKRLPLPTMLLRWNLKAVYQNRAARDFCSVWEKGPKEARLTKADSPIPSEILDRCRQLRQQLQRATSPRARLRKERVHHPRSPHLRATIRLRRLNAAGVARPHFLIECENLQVKATPGTLPGSAHLSHLVQLTRQEREIVRLICNGQSNQEIADEAGLSLATVKQHIHSIFRKLEVTSRGRLIALMR
jgi:DNA-binding CsgD family transcriptional regulator